MSPLTPKTQGFVDCYKSFPIGFACPNTMDVCSDALHLKPSLDDKPRLPTNALCYSLQASLQCAKSCSLVAQGQIHAVGVDGDVGPLAWSMPQLPTAWKRGRGAQYFFSRTRKLQHDDSGHFVSLVWRWDKVPGHLRRTHVDHDDWS